MELNKEMQDLGVLSSNEAELIDKVMLLDKNNYLNLIEECFAEISQAEPEEDSCRSVDVVNETCILRKYYTETETTVVERHFARSLPESLVKTLTEGKLGNMNESETPVKKTGASKRKAKRKPTVTSLLPSRAQVTTDARVHPYALMPPACRPQPSPSPPLPPRVKMGSGAYYMTPSPAQQCCPQYQAVRYSIKSESVYRENDLRPPVYTAYCQGNTLIEVYSPSVGRGFNPRYNSLLIEPTVQAFLPSITGLPATISVAMADIHTFQHMALEFNIPS